ncbi:C4-dicarboxylate TRAP transporter substrate-binding protein [Halomonas sp. HP20-15]|uniref:C4-dicarboxylate TRAP transporter substrate-binding protein n=1 Tax=Halomonas sp. HP20-15 TaxID=3085901 RepID=UPI002981A0DC|nr:C4-dicarboxylate TRAP transporter substrate-binding protein [Halomonas sp. HP20-15]MDW5376039.1 C4-dicarboxylate TRAP transporter substrate-binding protein [Halomonas sp. HP20-15]
MPTLSQILIRFTAPACTALAFASLAPGAAAAQEDYTLRFNHVLGPNEPFHQGFLKWAENVEERTDGHLKIDVFHSAQLGVEEDIIEQIRQGANIGQNTDAARLGNYVPGISVINGPYFIESMADVEKLNDAPTMQAWQKQLADDYGLQVVCFDWVQGKRHFFTNQEIHSPADLEGVRVRTPPAPIWQESIRALGAAPVAMDFGDVYSGLQSRAIDGAELVYPNITAGGLGEVLDYAIETGHITLVNFQVVSSSWFEGLPEEYQKILVEECRAAGQDASRQMEAAASEAKAQLQEDGMTVITDIDREAFKKAGEQAYEALGLTDAKQRLAEEIGK